MKRYYDIDPLFNQARRLPMEVSIEQVQGFLATSALPAGATKSWFYSLNFYIMLGIITGAIALLFNLSEGSPTISSKIETPQGLELAHIQVLPAQPVLATEPATPLETTKITGAPDQTEKPQASLEVAQQEDEEGLAMKQTISKQQPKKRTDMGAEKKSSLIIDDMADQLLLNPLPLVNFYGNSNAENENEERAFLITNEDTEESLAKTISEGRETSVRISNIKVKHKRNGDIKVMKLAFAVPHPNSSCDWKVFRTVELKGFKTYEYGWTVDENGNIINFWDKLNNKPPSEVPMPQKACGKVKYFCNN